jgi:cobalt/nickel transport protein
MSNRLYQQRNRAFVLSGLGIALLIAIVLSPFASSDPDGLDRVSEDLKFSDKALRRSQPRSCRSMLFLMNML